MTTRRPIGVRPAHEEAPGVEELGVGSVHPAGAVAVARLLLPHGEEVERHGDHGRALDHLDQAPGV
jgi:hypothetical protein